MFRRTRYRMTGQPAEADARRARLLLDDYNRTERHMVYIAWALCHRCLWYRRDSDDLCSRCRQRGH